MSWDLATAKAFLGITDPAQDTQIQLVLDYTLDLIELALARKLLQASFTETFRWQPSHRIILRNFPVDSITTINGSAPASTVILEQDTGIVYELTFFGHEEIEIEYIGGYATLPPALERVMWEIFMSEWGKTDATTGGPSTDATGTTGELRSVTVFDGFKLDYDTDVSGSGESVSAKQAAAWGRLAPWADVLQHYRNGVNGTMLGIA